MGLYKGTIDGYILCEARKVLCSEWLCCHFFWEKRNFIRFELTMQNSVDLLYTIECPTRALKTWKLETELEISSSSQVRFNHYQFQVFRFKTWRTRKFQVKSSLKSYKPEPEFFNHRSICDQTSHKTWWWYIKLSCFLKSFI